MPTDYERVWRPSSSSCGTSPPRWSGTWAWTTVEGWFKNKLVRQAVAYAVDREGVMKVGHDGRGVVLYNSATFAPAPTVLGAIQNPANKYSYDVERRRP